VNTTSVTEDDTLWIEDVRVLFKSAGLQRLVCVDDRSNGGSEMRASLAAAIRVGDIPLSEARIAFSGLVVGIESFDAEEIANEVRDSDLKAPPLSIRGMVSSPEVADASTIATLRDLASRTSLDFELLDLGQWKERRGEFLSAGTLVLFDKDMSMNPEGGTTTGVDLLISTLKDGIDVKAALFTHSVAIGEEFHEWKALADLHPEVSDRLLVISKHSFSDPNPEAFTAGMKVLIAVPEVSKVIRQIRSMYAKITTDALDELEKLSPYTLDRMFVGAIEEEGEWGPENFLSFVDAVQRKELRRSLHDNSAINEAITRLRGLASMTLRMKNPSKSEYMGALRSRKIDDSSYINSVRLPLDLGDIFKLHPAISPPAQPWAGDRYYILLLQRCDVALRAGSSRPGVRNFDPPHLVLHRIKKVGANAKPRRDTRLTYPIEYLVPGSENAWEVIFGDRITVPTMALDFCTLNVSGESVFKLDEKYEDLDQGLSLAAREMVRVYRARAQDIFSRYDAVAAKTQDSQLLGEISGSLLGATEPWTPLTSAILPDSKAIHYGVSRIARLRDPDVQDALDQLSAVQGRVALNAHLTLDVEAVV
jgi:hypothetical protein